eukprot:3033290-Amphidinium_carterae.1
MFVIGLKSRAALHGLYCLIDYNYSQQVARLQCQSQQRHCAGATAWQACLMLFHLLYIQDVRVGAKEQDGVDICKQGN